MSRPEKPIDWAKVDQLLMAGCTGTQICPHFDMHPNTFYARVEEKYNLSFTHYSSLKKEQGNSLLLAKQLEKAVSGKGDNTMLIWLGKQRLGQKEDQPQIKVSPEFEKQHTELMETIQKAQQAQEARKIEEIKSNEEQKS